MEIDNDQHYDCPTNFEIACDSCGATKKIHLLNAHSIIFTNCFECFRGMRITVKNGLLAGVLTRDSKQITKET